MSIDVRSKRPLYFLLVPLVGTESEEVLRVSMVRPVYSGDGDR